MIKTLGNNRASRPLAGSLSLLALGAMTLGCGGDGKDGADSLVLTTPEPAGANCEAGGYLVESGRDADGDGALGEEEVEESVYVCAGAGSEGASSLVELSDEFPGDNCAGGGTRIDVGLDNGEGEATAGDGVLDLSEIDNTAYVCRFIELPATQPLVHMLFNGDLENHGSVGGTAEGATAGFGMDPCGRATGAASFDTNSVTTPSVDLSGGAFTFAAWFKSSDTSSFNGLVAQPMPLDNGLGQLMLHNETLTSELILTPSTGLNAPDEVTDDAWHHVVMTFDEATNAHVLYVDGVEAASTSNTGTYSYTGGIFVGRLRDVAGSYTGLIDNVRIYDSALDAEEIGVLYNFERISCGG